MKQMQGGTGEITNAQSRIMSKVCWRLLPLLFLMYVFSYLDRINMGFAGLTMKSDLGLSAAAFGLGGSIFYAGYALSEIPSNLLMVRFGARRWLARIMITWGIASALTMFVYSAGSLYVMRLLVGVFEAGFQPGVLLYLTYWFPRAYLGRANALFMVGGPVAMATGAAASGFILEHANGVGGLHGWQWMFLIEGVPSIILGIVCLLCISDGPDTARWLSREEVSILKGTLGNSTSTEKRGKQTSKGIWKQLASKNVLLLSLVYFCLSNTFTANSIWTPTIAKGVLQGFSLSSIGLIVAIPALCSIVCMPLWTWSSDRKNERHWHLIIALAVTACGWLLVGRPTGMILPVVGIICTTVGSFSAMSVFWTLPQQTLSEEARPAGLALLNVAGVLGALCSPAVIGILRDMTGNFSDGLYYVASLLIVAIFAVLFVARPSHDFSRGEAEEGQIA